MSVKFVQDVEIASAKLEFSNATTSTIESGGNLTLNPATDGSTLRLGTNNDNWKGVQLDGESINFQSEGTPTMSINNVGNVLAHGTSTADSFIVNGGTSSGFLKADGSIDTTTYSTGSTSNFVNLTSNQNINGLKTFNNGVDVVDSDIRVSLDGNSNEWKDLTLKSYVTEAEANALDDGNYILTTSPSSNTSDSFDKYGGIVIQGRDDGNSRFAVRLGSGSGHSDKMVIKSSGETTFSGAVKFESTFGNLDTTNDLGMQFEIGTSSQNTLRTDADAFRIYMGGSGAVGTVYNVTQGGEHTWDGTSGGTKMKLTTSGDLHVDGDITAYSTSVSDVSMKDNIKTIENATETVKALRGVSYDWTKGARKGKSEIGLIAQEVEQVLPDLVHDKELIDGSEVKTIDYQKIIGLLIESNKELSDRLDNLEGCSCKK